MKKESPVVLAAATYSNRYDAVNDFDSVMSAKRDGEFDHIAAAVLTKDASCRLQVDRHDSTAKHLAWGVS